MTELNSNQNLIALTITAFPKFCELLVERIHTTVEHYCEVRYFTIFVSLTDRSKEGSVGEPQLILAGLDAQKRLLEQAFLAELIHKHPINAQKIAQEKAAKVKTDWQAFKKNKEVNDPLILGILERYRKGHIPTFKQIKGGNLHSFLKKKNQKKYLFADMCQTF